MKTHVQRTAGRHSTLLQHYLATAQQLALAILCGLLLTSGALAQEGRPEPPEQPAPEAAPTQKPPDPNETLTPSPLANQTVDGDLVFTSPGGATYARDIRLSDNFGGLRFYGATNLTSTPPGAAIQFFGNNASPFNGQLYLDSGAHSLGALIFRTVPTGGTITERMRVTSAGNLGIGTASPVTRLHVVGSGSLSTAVRVENNGGVGVYAIANGSNSAGVVGVGDVVSGVEGYTSTGAGVYGYSGSSGQGVIGQSSTNQGVYGLSNSGTGVYGVSNSGFAGYFVGPVHVTGTLSKGGGSFKIDHPLDPENKYLSHSFVESPDMMNIYNGNATTDARGRAIITLPAYFTTLNRDYRYQLTVIGKFAHAVVASKIKDNQFVIKTNKPRVEVSWQVTGIRQDAYAEAHRIRVEEEKVGAERGAYLHPEAFGQPQEKAIGHARNREPRPTVTEKPTKQTTTVSKREDD